MATSRRPPMLSRTEVKRAGSRTSVVIPGQCQVGERPVEDVLVTDLDAQGCRVRGSSIGVTKTEPVRLWLAEVGPVAARLKWLKHGSLGLVFEAELDPAVVRQLLDGSDSPASTNVVPLSRRSAS